MSKPRKLLPITEYLMEHVTARMWGYRNPTLYLDRVLRKWFGDMKWNTRHNELVELDEEFVYAIMKKPITTDEMVKEICTKFGQRQTENRMPSSTNAKWCIDRLNEAKLNVNEIGDKFHFDNKVVVHLNVINRTIECLSLINYDEEENVDDLVEACVGLLAMRRIKKSNSKYDEYYQRFEQAIAEFKDKK